MHRPYWITQSLMSSARGDPPAKPINVYGKAIDLEAQSSPINEVPRSKLVDSFSFPRRRLRQQSLNLDEDLGHPPAYHHEPPDAFVPGSLPESSSMKERFRVRSKSDAASLLTTGRKMGSGLIVFFPSSSADNSPRTPTNGDASAPVPSPNASPRRPLYVDTQLANGLTIGEKRKSPVASMFEYVKSRTRTGSFSSANPAPVSSRCGSSSLDTAMPQNSPRCRVPVNKYTRVTGTQRSLDSGLDLASPTISNTALLIKESSLFPSFDSMTLGSTFSSDFSTVFFESQDGVYSLFMKAHKCYDLIPVSSKLVVFDTHLPVRKAFFALVYNGVRAAPLWDSVRQQFVGMLTITDFIKILYGYKKEDETAKLHALEEQEISHWREKFEENGERRNLISIDPNESLHRAVELLCSYKVHRLPVLDQASGNISYILTHKRIMKFLSLYMYDLPKPSFMDKTPRELEIGSWGSILTVHTDTPLIDALQIFLKNRVSALPLVDGDDKVVDIYAKFDVIALAADKVYENLDVTVHEALRHRSDWFEGVHCCHESDNLFTVLETIVKAEVHRLIAVDADRRVVGVVSLSDILKYLVLDTAHSEPMEVCTEYTQPIFGTLEEETHVE